jgi:aqualysin 1
VDGAHNSFFWFAIHSSSYISRPYSSYSIMKSIIASSLLVSSTMGAELKTAQNGKAIASQYIIRMNPDQSVTGMRAHIKEMQSRLGREMETTSVYEALGNLFLGYSARLTPRALEALISDPRLMYIEEDQVVSLDACNQEPNADWGLARVGNANYNATGSFSYPYVDGGSGLGVNAYIIDTGIYCENNDFTGKAVGTCTFGESFVYNGFGPNKEKDVTDGNGHGTHCAGSVAGQTYGIAKEANLIAVKVLSDSGSGSTTGVIDGINWVATDAAAKGKPSVANLSLGGGFSQANNDAVTALVAAGVTVAVAAGNDNADACDYSPASTPAAITVAASDKTNARASYSNYGSCVDIYGPGSAITSAWIGSPSATNTISGTSMASPHVAGAAANVLSRNTGYTPAQVTTYLINNGVQDQITGNKVNTPNLMVQSNCVN